MRKTEFVALLILLSIVHSAMPATSKQTSLKSPGLDFDRTCPPITPAWAYGHWVWEDIEHTRDAVEYLVGGYRAYKIPVNAVIFDSPCFMAYNDFKWNETAYPNPQVIIDDLHRRQIKAVVFYTGAINRKSNDSPTQKCESYDFVLSNDYVINHGQESQWWKGPALHIDFTNPQAVAWWNTQLASLHKMGIDGAKIDAAHMRFGDTVDTSIGTMDSREFGYHYFKQSFDYHTAQNDEFVAMTYAWSTNKLVGWPSTSHVSWTGDFRGDWQGMKDQLRNIYLSAQVGFSALACEIGGYFEPASTKEQFIRYAQMSCFMPVMINGGMYGALNHHLPWRYDDQTLDIYRKLVLTHNNLGPYLFSTGVDAHLNHLTIIRDSSIENESHCLGPWLFVKAITSSQDSIHLTLPADSQWFDLWTDKRYDAGAVVERHYSIEEYPVFVKAGAIIPISGDNGILADTDNSLSKAATFVLYPGQNSDYVFHRPKGTGKAYSDIHITYNAPAGTIEVKSETEDTFRFIVKTNQPPTNVSGADTWLYDDNQKLLQIEKHGKDFQMTINTPI